MEFKEFAQLFVTEANELIPECESLLLELESAPDDQNLLDSIFRNLHTIKGTGAMVGFDQLSSFTHHIEDLFDLLRNDTIRVSKEIIDVTLKALDCITVQVNDPVDDEKFLEQTKDVIDEIKLLSNRNTDDEDLSVQTEDDSVIEENSLCSYIIHFTPHAEIFLRGTRVEKLIEELMGLGRGYVFSSYDDLPGLDEINSEHCFGSWSFILNSAKGINSIKDVFMFVEDCSSLEIKSLGYLGSHYDLENIFNYGELREVLDLNDRFTDEDMSLIIENQNLLFNQQSTETREISVKGNEKTDQNRNKSFIASKKNGSGTIRVKESKLDQLINLVGEMITTQARLNQQADIVANDELKIISERMERITNEVYGSTMGMRMVPVADTFSSFNRLIRDLSHKLGKKVKLSTSGDDTEVDKNVIESLKDPLVHIIRNSMDHGIEIPEERIVAGKNETGTIELKAEHSGSNVVLTITDDGNGLDEDKIVQKAISRGIISPTQVLTRQEKFNLIFEPGFSTSEKTTKVSGRGVGMDVVKKNIEKLRGNMEIDSEPGQGTTMKLYIPLTLSIIQGLIVKAGPYNFIINLSNVVECDFFSRDYLEGTPGRNSANVRGELLPLIRLDEHYGYHTGDVKDQHIVIIKTPKSDFGLIVDEVLGQHQAVIKSLNEYYEHINDISGTTILGDGSISLILDVDSLTNDLQAVV